MAASRIHTKKVLRRCFAPDSSSGLAGYCEAAFQLVLVTSSSAFVPYFVPFMLLGALRRDSNLDRRNWQRFCIVVSLSVFAFFESTLLYCYNSMQFVGKGLYVGMAMMGLFIAAYALVLLCLWKRRKIDPEIAG